MKFGDKLKQLRNKADLTQSELAKISGVSSGQISLLENDERKITQDSFNKVISALGIKEEDFFGSGLSYVDVPEKQPRPIPVISWIHAGEFAEAANHWPVGVSGDEEPVYSYVKTGPHTFGLRVQGDSMLPRIMPGDIAIVDPEQRCDNGSMCVVMVNGEVAIKFFWDRETEIVLKSMNDKYPDSIIHKDSKADFKVIGKIVAIDARF